MTIDADPSAYSSSFIGHDVPSEHDRLRTLEAYADPHTFAIIDRLGLPGDIECLELGAGAGSVARYLAARFPEGHVTATDADIRFLDPMPGNVRVIQHDAAQDPMPPGPFDLIHARALFCHLPSRSDVLRRAAGALAPHGILLIEDPSTHPVDASPHPAYRAAMLAIERLLGDTLGSDLRWARSLPAELVQAGLTGVTLNAAQIAIGDRGTGDEFTYSLLVQAAPALCSAGLITAAEMRSAIEFIKDPDTHDLGYTLMSAWGRRARM
jgi:SAM-dependent methyltransferase